MKRLFSKLENSIYYGFSRTFWHIVSFLGIIVIIAGIAVFGWSHIPPSKKEVIKQVTPEKPPYPKPVSVNFEDVYFLIPKEASKIKEEQTEIYNQPQPETTIAEDSVIDTEALSAFNLQITKLKTLISDDKNRAFWNGEGRYIFIDERKYNITKNEAYRRFEYSSTGFETKFIKFTDRKNITDYYNKAELLNALNNLLSKVDESQRIELLEQFMLKRINSLSQTTNNLNNVSKLLIIFPTEDALNAFENLYNTSVSDASFVDFLSEILSDFTIEERYTTLKTIKNELRSYSSNFKEFQNITNNFIPLLQKFAPNQQALALKYYYKAYKNKNQDRLSEVNQIDKDYYNLTNQIEQNYLSEIANEEALFYGKQATKSEFKFKSLYGVAIGIGVIIIITIVLLLLAMIRNVNRLAQVILENKERT